MESIWWLLGQDGSTDGPDGRSGSPVPAPGVGGGEKKFGSADGSVGGGKGGVGASAGGTSGSGGDGGSGGGEGSGGGGEAGSGKESKAEAGGAARTELKLRIPPSLTALSMPHGLPTGGRHNHYPVEATKFAVRGKTYASDGVKVPARPSLFTLVRVEVFRCEEPVLRVAMKPGSFLRAARKCGDKRRYLVVAFQTPADDTHLVLYFAADHAHLASAPASARRVWERLWRGEPGGDVDAFRKERWKVIPSVVDGAWVVQTYVGDKPALLATKLTHTWTKDEDLDVLEVDCDVASSSAAAFLVSMLHSYAAGLVIDIAVLAQGNAEEELPEQILGAVRLNKIDINAIARIKPGQYGAWAHELDDL